MPVGKVPGAGSLPYLLQTVAQSFYLTAPPHHRRTPSHLFLTRNGCMYQQVFQSLQKANRIYLIFFIILRSIYFLEFLSNYSLVQYLGKGARPKKCDKRKCAMYRPVQYSIMCHARTCGLRKPTTSYTTYVLFVPWNV
jgi:hypothetical protein